jgi:hypothetical protein
MIVYAWRGTFTDGFFWIVPELRQCVGTVGVVGSVVVVVVVPVEEPVEVTLVVVDPPEVFTLTSTLAETSMLVLEPEEVSPPSPTCTVIVPV